jgi:8-oxo-dGTP pyrophosphatase MutT (NUDIX family)
MPQIASRIVDVCVFRFLNDRPEYLLLKRAHDEELYPGLWQFVSGTIEPPERAIESALRELQEEAALVPASFWVAPHVSMFFDHVHDTVNVSPMFVAQVAVHRDPRLSREHSEYSWLPFVEARQRLVWPVHRTGLEIVHSFVAAGTDAAFFSRVSF